MKITFMKNRVIASFNYSYASLKLGAIILILLGIIGVFVLSLVANFNNFNIYSVIQTPFEVDTLPYFLPGLATFLFLVIGFIMFLLHILKKNKINKLLTNGKREEASIISSIQDFSVTNNKVPRRIVKFKTNDGQVYTFKSFDYGLVPHLTENKVIPIIHNEKGDVFPDPEFFIDQVENKSQSSKGNFENQFSEKCMTSGDEHLRNKNLQGALLAYEMAYEKEASQKIIQKIAETYEKLGDSEKAKAFRDKLK